MEIELWQLLALLGLTFFASFGLIWALSSQSLGDLKRQLQRDTEVSMAAFLIFLPAQTFWLLVGSTAVPIGLVAYIILAKWWWALIAALCYLACLPWLRAVLLRQRRQKLEQQLPGALQLLASSLNAGLSLLPALDLAARQLSPPLKTEFRLLVQRQRTGDSLALALSDIYRRSPSALVRFFTFALETGNKYGGQQVQMLERMARAMQQQHYAKQRMLSLSAQARLQGKIMFVLPIGLFFAIGEVQQDTKVLLLTTTSGQLLLLLCACLMLIGVLLTRRLMGRFNDDV
ncbi:hypothetical protein PSI9734_02372 [Pseudidiomarina piscicola]|uniref:Type II secretion system protein GspF domain-containing protein n=1 Tax=Pseudidiomarina piscicola TaxID=2614830 RepID=A0A6S6WQF2_9GAMM|nr:type II secretion system F family protein [Pseudidiomarina piscicola]CAB0152024.1 hypothetical protein PSI9734_02372 [Pseudidiomarina piscicola]VZT41466.1 hypothetical protein PSI9734_02372 [Pseudomonas aeruginosa]